MRQKGVIYKKMLGSFLIILIVPLLAVSVYGLYTHRSVEEYVDMSNANMLKTIRNVCDREILSYQDMLLQLSRSTTVKSIGAESNSQREKQYLIYSLVNEMSDLLAVMNRDDSYCKGIFVCLKSEEIIVSETGKFKQQDYIAQLCAEEEIESVQGYLSESGFFRAYGVKMNITKNSHSVLITTSLQDMTVGMWLSDKIFSNVLDSESWGSGLDWIILDDNNQYIRSSPLLQMQEEGSLWIEENNFEIEGKEYFASGIASEIMDWQYFLLTPETVIDSQVRKIGTAFCFCIIGCLAISFLLLKIVLQTNYKPIKDLMDLFVDKECEQWGEIWNEHLYLKEHVENLMQEYSSSDLKLKKNSDVLQKYFLEKILEGRLLEEHRSKDVWEKTVKKFEDKQNVVLLLKWENYDIENEAEEDVPEREPLDAFITKNVSEEILGMHFSIETVEMEEAFAIIIPQKETTPEFYQRLEEIIGEIQEFIYGNFSFNVRAAVSDVHTGCEGVHKGYLESCEVIELFAVLEQDFVCYQNIKNKTNRMYGYSYEMEKYITNALRSGEAAKAGALIKKVLEINFSLKETSPELLKCLIYDLYGTILKVCGEENINNYSEFLNMENMFADSSLKGICNRFDEIAQDVCRNIQNIRKEDKTMLRCRMILDYIKENYHDPNLSVSQIGEHFGMTSSYLSAIYKKQTGKSLATVINETRVQEAISLLEKGYAVNQVAEKTGFIDNSVFIKVFKKYTGVTPGQMKIM